ncbi:MAG: alkaline phosphatase [Syntrophus sp. (in: bacteria)]|nr:alkaline phosphatase [Syntrophus sp. (in: bacteria)]
MICLHRKTGTNVFIALCLFSLLFAVPFPAIGEQPRYKNVIVLVGDGMGSTHTTITRWYKKGMPLALDRMYIGGIRTYGADSLITDSAPAATAFASGHKTGDKMIGILPGKVTIPGVPAIPDELHYKPVATILEGAKATGRSVGVVATSNIQHATPAAFTAHWPDRGNYNEIAKQQAYLNIDVLFGGGRRYLRLEEDGGTRTDGEDLLKVLASRGYRIVSTRKEMLAASSTKIWGLFADDDMAYEFDRRRFSPEQPTLAEMTIKSIQLLSKNPKGFFLFVEGSKIDWASHANDPIGVISDVLAFDDAVGIAVDFAEKDRQTLVVALSDHGCGGMSLGSKNAYSTLQWEAVFTSLKKALLTGEGIEAELAGTQSEGKIREVMSKYYGISSLKPEEVKAIQGAQKGRMNSAVGPMISARSHINWTTGGHTGEDLFIYLYGIRKPIALMENTGIAHMIAGGMGFDLTSIDRRLFVQADQAFGAIGAKTAIDRLQSENPVLIVQKGNKRAELPFGKNIMKITSPSVKTYTLEGITVLAPITKKAYIPRQAVSLFNKTE